MKKIILQSFALSILLLILIGCVKEEHVINTTIPIPKLPDIPYNYAKMAADIDEHILLQTVEENDLRFFFDLSNIFPNAIPVSNKRATLGRVLFYDKQLSKSNTVSCGSCHQQSNAFADANAFSAGFSGQMTHRNTMSIVNMRVNNNLFWDSRAATLEALALLPIQNSVEMGLGSIAELENKLQKLPYYPYLFEEAYGTPDITEGRIANAIAQFLSTIGSVESKFDQAQKGLVELSPLEKKGEALFFSEETQCSSCHAGPNFSAPDFRGAEYGRSDSGDEDRKGTANIGLDLDYADNGIANGRFKIPSLRNIALTAPYMHDGRLETLEEVIEHYDSEVKPHDFLDEKFIATNSKMPARLDLSDYEKEALVAFLHTLTDEQILQDIRLSDPFED